MDKAVISRKIKNCQQETFAACFLERALMHPDKSALEWKDSKTGTLASTSYGELADSIMGLGQWLYGAGLQGSCIALVGDNSYEWILAFLTVLCSDMRVVVLDPGLSPEELARRIEFADARAVFAADNIDVTRVADVSVYSLSELAGLLEGVTKLDESNLGAWLDTPITEKQVVLLMFTSGTGGHMKLAMLRQEGLTLERWVWQGLRMQESNTLITLPLFHIAGNCNLRGALMVGTTAYISAGLRNLLEEYAYVKPKVGFMVPAQAMLLYGVLVGKDKETGRALLGGNFSAIRSTGAPLPDKVRQLFEDYDIRVTSDYGMTETSGAVSVSQMRDEGIYSKLGSVGHILDAITVQIDNPDENGRGEVIVSGQCVFEGYYKNEEETGAILQDGWIKTGDIGYIDEEGFLFLVGRKKNIIILPGGENIIPEELENMIFGLPGVTECRVYERDNRLCVSIYSKEEADETIIKKEVWELNGQLPSYKRIQAIYLESEPLPRTSTGKILR